MGEDCILQNFQLDMMHVKMFSLKCMKGGCTTAKNMMLYCSNYALTITMRGLFEVRKSGIMSLLHNVMHFHNNV